MARNKWPALVNDTRQEIESTLEKVSFCCSEAQADGFSILRKLKELRAEILENRLIPQLITELGSDIGDYNTELKLLGPVSWHNSPWLFTECYLFRRLHTLFSDSRTNFWRDFDIWHCRKVEALEEGRASIIELVRYYLDLERSFNHARGVDSERDELDLSLEELLEISLWGNSADLLSPKSALVDGSKNQQSKDSRTKRKQNILVNDVKPVLATLRSLKAQQARKVSIHIVLDNAGLELVSDLILSAALLTTGCAHQVVFHGKAFPWYISDATLKDFDHVVESFFSPADCPTDKATSETVSALRHFGTKLKGWLSSSSARLIFSADPFWTTAHPFARLPEVAPQLLSQLQDAALVIFKGDLNYRKLIAGGRWPPTTPFKTAIGPVADFGIRILALRTCKGDACVGLTRESAYHVDPAGTGYWTRTGEYGVISYFDEKVRVET